MRALRWKKLALGTVFTALALALLYCSQVVLLPLALAAPAVKVPSASTVPTAGSTLQVKQVSWAVRVILR